MKNNPYFAMVQRAENARGFVPHAEGNLGQAPEVAIASDVDPQYIQCALNAWRWENAWADFIPWEQLPPKFQDTVRLAAGILAKTGYSQLGRSASEGK
jgi:hypothetical protein